jgi:hypothetical protein
VATNTDPLCEAPVSRGFDLLASLGKLWNLIGSFGTRPMMALYPEEAAAILRYQERRDRLLLPHPLEGEAGPARTMFLLEKYEGERKLYSVDTETQEIIPLAFLAYWKGYPEHHDLDISPKAKAASGQY